MKEIITLQFGTYANYIGSHYWNIQDELFGDAYSVPGLGGELDSDMLYRLGTDAMGRETYTPRLLVFDIAGSQGLNRAMNSSAISLARRALYSGGGGGGGGGKPTKAEGEDEDDDDTNDLAELVDKYSKQQHTPNPFLRYLEGSEGETTSSSSSSSGSNAAGTTTSSSSSNNNPTPADAFFDLDSLVTCWGDYLKAQYHHKSMVPIGGRSAAGDTYGTSEATALSSGNASFDAFPLGAQFQTESMCDVARAMLEECDGIQGFQACVDVDSGFGGLALEYLTYLREECPRAPMLIFGALPPHYHHDHSGSSSSSSSSLVGGGGGEDLGEGSTTAGAFNYAHRDRENIRNINIGLAFASFGGGHSDLDATFIPLTLQSYAEAVEQAARAARGNATDTNIKATSLAAWFPGLHRPNANKHFQTSAMLASAWDSFTMPFRRRGGDAFKDALLPVSKYEGELADTADRRGIATSSSSSSGGSGPGVREATDSRVRHSSSSSSSGSGRAIDSHMTYDPAIETVPDSPLVSLSSSITMKEYLGLLSPSPHLRVSTLSMGIPLPYPRGSATTMSKMFGMHTPIHEQGVGPLMPLSWTCAIPSAWGTRKSTLSSTSTGQSAAQDGGGGSSFSSSSSSSSTKRKQLQQSVPFAHTMVMRGVGSHAVAAGGTQYRSTLDAYGRVLDGYLSRTPCRVAGHAVLRTPLPIPLSFPAFFPNGLYDTCGAAVGSVSSAGVHAPPFLPSTLATDSLVFEDTHYADYQGISTPFSIPLLTHAACTPAYGPNMTHVSTRFQRRDHGVLHRFAFAERGSAGAQMELGEAEAILGGMVDDYNLDEAE